MMHVIRIGPRVALSLLLAAALVGGCSSDHDDGSHGSTDGGANKIKAPSDLKVSLVDGGAHLTWKDNSSDEAQFMIERKQVGGSFEVLATVPFDTSQYHDTTPVKGISYVYRVMAMGKSGHDDTASDYSNEATFKRPDEGTPSDAGATGGTSGGGGAGGSDGGAGAGGSGGTTSDDGGHAGAGGTDGGSDAGDHTGHH